jgi:hypothetical protein
VPHASDIVDSKDTSFNDDDRVFLDSPYTLGGDISNEHITAVVDFELSSSSENSLYMSDEAHTSTSTLSTIDLDANEAHDALTHEPGRLYATKNTTVLIIRPRTSFLSLGVLSKPPPDSAVPAADWKSSINNTLSSYSCGPCAHQNSAFEDSVTVVHKKYEDEFKGGRNPRLDVRVHETRSVTVEESWREPAHSIVYSLPAADSEKNVVGSVEVF